MDGKWLFTGLFASLGFVLGGLYALVGGLHAAIPPPPPPGTGGCGLAVLGGWMLVFVSPVVALVFATLGGFLGVLIDSVRNEVSMADRHRD
jgi:hypothetical protein